MSVLRPSVCVDAVLAEMEITQAVALVRQLGFPAFEFWSWWEKDLDALIAARDAANIKISSCCTRFISLVDPGCRTDYLNGLTESIAAARRLGTRRLISQVGDTLEGVGRDQQHASIVEGLKRAADLLQDTGITLVIEPLNERVDHPGYFLVHSEEAFEIIDQVGSPQIKVVFDIYHQQVSEGHLIHNITRNIDKIAHFHAAGNPGRNELDHGEIHYPRVFEAIRQTGYDGFVGLEYWPDNDPLEGLRRIAGWFPEIDSPVQP